MSFLVLDKIPILAETDVLIVGAGSAGCCAALAAREWGKYGVILLERYGFAGGTSTQMLDTFYGFFTPGEEPRKVVGGIPDRVVDKLDLAGAVLLRPNTYGAGTGVNYNPERLKRVWDELLQEAGDRYQNGGIWPWVGGLYVAALVKAGRFEKAEKTLRNLASALRLGKDDEWEFNENLHGITGKPTGAKYQAWSAGMYLYAQHCVDQRQVLDFKK